MKGKKKIKLQKKVNAFILILSKCLTALETWVKYDIGITLAP